mgnify:CR=1 FL=1
MNLSRRRWALATVLVALAVLHVVDPWGGRGPDVAGMPWDLAYHLLWMIAAAAAVLYMTYRVWPDEPG